MVSTEEKFRDCRGGLNLEVPLQVPSASEEVVHPVHTVRVILPLFLSAEGRHRPSLDMSDGIPSMGALRARRPEIQAVPVDCLCCAQATGELHHQKVDAGTSGCIDPFCSTPTRSPIHLAPRRLLLDDLNTTCWILHAAQSLTSKAGSRSRS